MNVMISRTSPTTLEMSWTPLTLYQARGFVTYYFVVYYPLGPEQEISQIQNVILSPNLNFVVIEGLNATREYNVTIFANTIAGLGIPSDFFLVELSGTVMKSKHLSTSYSTM